MDSRPDGGRIGLAYGIGSPLFLALVPIFVTLGYEGGAGVIPLLLTRTAIAAAFAWALVLMRPGRDRALEFERGLLIASIAGVVLNPIAGYIAIEKLGPALYAAFYFIHVPVLAIMVPRREGRAPGVVPLLGALGCAVGVALVAGLPESSSGFDLVGLVAAAINVGAFLVMALILHDRGGTFDPVRFVAQGMGLAALTLAAIYVVGFGDEAISGHTWAISAAIAAVWLPGRLCWTLAVHRVGARAAALLGSLQPMFVALLGLAVLGEGLAILQWVGIGVICISVAWVHMGDSGVVSDLPES